MVDYRLYLLDATKAIKAREEFLAPNDADALIIASVVADACADEHAGYELWSLARCVFGPSPAIAPPSLSELSQGHQQAILDLVDALQRSRWAVAKSRRLIEKKNELRALLDGRNTVPDRANSDPLAT